MTQTLPLRESAVRPCIRVRQNVLMRPTRAPRLVRGASAATIATFVALLSHVSAGGSMPAWLGLLVPWTLSFMVCTVLSGRRLSQLRLVLAVGVSQLLFHVLFALGSVRPTTRPVTGASHSHGVELQTLLPEAAPIVPADASMWLGHAVGVAITVIVIRHGEQTLRRLLTAARVLGEWTRRTISRALPTTPRVDGGIRLTPTVDVVAVVAHPVLRRIQRRGPPVFRYS